MPITAQNYERAKKMSTQSGLSDEVRTRLLEDIEAFEGSYLQKAAPAESTPTGIIGQPAAAPTEDALVGEVKRRLDPGLSLPAQALATQPATTHPGGDKAAADEWMRQGPAGGETVMVYEMPTSTLRQKLLDNPQIMPALGFKHVPPDPNTILNMDPNDPLFQAAQDYYWRETADAAAKAGKTAYRYAKAPWLHGDGMGPIASNLALKVKGAVDPAVEGALAFVMGVDNTATFGAGRAASEVVDDTLSPEGRGPAPEGTAGGIASAEGAKAGEVNDMITEEHPAAYAFGQVAGIAPGLIAKGAGKAVGLVSKTAGEAAEAGIRRLAPWSASNALFDTITEAANAGARRVASLEKGAGLALAPVAAGAAGYAAAAGTNLAQEGVDATKNVIQTGSTGSTLGEALERSHEVGKVGAGIGAAGGVAASLARAGGEAVREGEHYGGHAGRFEAGGGRFEVGKGATSPELDAAREAAKTRVPGGTNTVDVLAKDLAPKMEEAAGRVVKGKIERIGSENERYFATAEGQERLPAGNLVGKTLELLDQTHGPVKRAANEVRAVGIPNAGKALKGIFNINVGGVSTEASEGAFAIPVAKANEYLNDAWKGELATGKAARPGKKAPAPKSAPEGSSLDFVAQPGKRGRAPREDGGSDFLDAMKKKGVDVVYVTPRAYNAQHHERALKLLHRVGKDNINDRDIGELEKALFADRDARKLNGEKGGFSKLQGERQAEIRQAKDDEARVAPKNESRVPGGRAYPKLVQRAERQKGELDDLEALQRVAEFGGLSPGLARLRLIEPYEHLRSRQSFGPVGGKPRSMWSPSGWQDAIVLRGAYPMLQELEGPLGPLGMGSAARTAVVGESEREEKRRSERDAPKVEGYSKARKEKLDELNDRRSRRKEKKK